jgi:hypothetical protein
MRLVGSGPTNEGRLHQVHDETIPRVAAAALRLEVPIDYVRTLD